VARVRALLRRAEGGSASRLLRVADIAIDLDAHTVTRAEQPIELTPTEFNLLATLAAQPGRAFSRSQLLEAAQGVNTSGVSFEGYERAIDAHIKNLRAKLELDPKKPRYVETVFGIGYRFIKVPNSRTPCTNNKDLLD
jgi:DNA-binding response OmpR family regulator